MISLIDSPDLADFIVEKGGEVVAKGPGRIYIIIAGTLIKITEEEQ